jgi:hypothetical protein
MSLFLFLFFNNLQDQLAFNAENASRRDWGGGRAMK